MTLLRMPNNGAKEEQGTSVIVYGTEINTFNLIARLPQEKLKKVRDATSAALGSKYISLLDIRSRIRCLSFYAKVIRLGRVFMETLGPFRPILCTCLWPLNAAFQQKFENSTGYCFFRRNSSGDSPSIYRHFTLRPRRFLLQYHRYFLDFRSYSSMPGLHCQDAEFWPTAHRSNSGSAQYQRFRSRGHSACFWTLDRVLDTSPGHYLYGQLYCRVRSIEKYPYWTI